MQLQIKLQQPQARPPVSVSNPSKIFITLTLGHFLLAVSLVGILGGDRGYMVLLSAALAFSL